MHDVSRLGPRALLIVAFACFFISGMSGLIYEVVWTRMLTQVFGNTTYAVATVLTAFMAGLALGSYLLGLVADKGKNNFRLYGILEAGVGIYGLLVPLIFKLVQSVYVPLFSLNESHPLAFNLVLFLVSLVFLLVPTLLMGATLPILSRFFIHDFNHLGRRLGDLYATNTVGAVFGCALAGYWLIPALGMHSTVQLAAVLNLVVAAVIFATDWARVKEAAAGGLPEAETSPQRNPSTLPSWSGAVLLVSIALSGFAALVYENSWTRALTMVIGTSVYSFTTMLVTFLVGLALGGFLYARIFGRQEVGIRTLGVIELLVGMTALATIPLFERLPFLFLRLLFVIGESFSMFLAIQLLLSALVMLVPTVLLGMTFPLVAQLFTHDLYRIGRSVGTSYAANTVGAILGAFAGGFIFIPTLGVQNTIILGVALNLLVGWFLLVLDTRWALQWRMAAGAVVLAALVVIPWNVPTWDPHIMTSGVTIYDDLFQDLPTDSQRLQEMQKDKILYYREGLTVTVSVHQSDQDYLYFKTNGKIDGSHGDALTQGMVGYLPLFLHPAAKSVAVIGLGTGMTVKAVGAFPVQKIDVLEIEHAMVEASAFFGDLNSDILQDPRVRLIFTDARNYIMATPKRYDIIISEPSNPWIAGIANLYTREFYQVAKSKLQQDGIFAQWFHNYSMSVDDFRMVFRTFGEAFPHISVWELGEEDFLLVGSHREQLLDAEAVQQRIDSHPDLKDDLVSLQVGNVSAILNFYRMGRKELMDFTKGAAINTDDGAHLEYSAPKNVRLDTSEENRRIMEPFVVRPPWPGSPDSGNDDEAV